MPYTAIVDRFASFDAVFTRHPVTGIITKHARPFNSLPEFSLSAHPCLAQVQAAPVVLRQRPLHFPIMEWINSYMFRHQFKSRIVPTSLAKNLQPRQCGSSKRKLANQQSTPSILASSGQASGRAVDEGAARPAKRARIGVDSNASRATSLRRRKDILRS